MNPTIILDKPTTISLPHPSPIFPQLPPCKTTRDMHQLHANLIKTGHIQDPLLSAQILRFAALSRPPNRDLHYAHKVFDLMPQPNCFSWNTIIRALSETNNSADSFQALALFTLMLENEFVVPNRFTFPSVLKACGKLGLYEEGKQLHCMVKKLGLEDDDYVLSSLLRLYVICGVMGDAYILFKCASVCGNIVLWNVMIDGYVRNGEFDVARELFNEMPQRGVVSWNSMVSGYAQNGFFLEAVELFRQMQVEGVVPNYVTLVSVLPAISRLGALEMGKWVHFFALRNEIEIDEVFGSALVDMYAKCGSIEKARQVFESVHIKNVITWNAIIGGLAMHGRGKEAIDEFWRMEQVGVVASDVTYISALSACSHAGLVSEGREIFKHMIEVARLKPRLEHFGCMVDLLGRSGLLKEAEQLVREMPYKPDDVILKALLAACKIHNNIEMGKCVAKLLMDMAPRDSGSYVALSNMYASSGNWEEVAEVRLLMKEMDVRKDPGCSWIELDGAVHEFLVEDDSHPKANEIRFMLEELSKQLSLAGYMPNTTQVLLKVNDKEKVDALHYHSEKIALAFGLISTSPKTPLRIVKNLRICDDCHSSMKLVSKLYKREIIVRDRKRFHHFENGTCSCMDYW